jgi:hypothetical protein
MATALTDTRAAVRADGGTSRFWPRSLRWRLQLWLAVLLVSMLAAMMISAYELARSNRMRQIDTDVEARLTALSLNVREFYRDGPPPPRMGGGPGTKGSPADGPPPDRRTPPSPDRLSPDRHRGLEGRSRRARSAASRSSRVGETGALFGAEAGYYYGVVARWRDG